MREIKFRGKDVYDNEWEYGGYMEFLGRPQIAYEDNGIVCHIDVDHATVGQFTGLRDAKGVEIYEGDLVRTMHGVYEVVFESGAYRIKKGSLRFILVDGSCYEVLGNVHEHKSGEMK